MVNENVGSVLQSLSTNNARVSRQAINGYRAATNYLLDRLQTGFKVIGGSGPKERIHGRALRAVGTVGERVTGYWAKTLGQVSDNAEKIVVRIDGRTYGAIDKVAAEVSKIGNARAVRYVGFAGRVSLPPLKLARDVSAWIATRAESRLAPHAPKRAAPKKARKTAKASRKTSASKKASRAA
jgi:hypothetical protein